MKRLNLFSLCSIFALSLMLFSANTVSAQSQDDGVLDKINKYVNGETKTDNYTNNRTKQKVSVSISDLSLLDRASYSSIHSAFKGSEDLAIEDIAFAPDFGKGFFFLSFALEDEETTKVVVLDVAGREVHSETIEDFEGVYESKINIPASEKGTYFLKVIQGFSLLNKKLIIE